MALPAEIFRKSVYDIKVEAYIRAGLPLRAAEQQAFLDVWLPAQPHGERMTRKSGWVLAAGVVAIILIAIIIAAAGLWYGETSVQAPSATVPAE